MKLKLEVVRDISVLIASGPIAPDNFAILKAGIKKLFKDGKNKIILELPDSAGFTPEILREFAILNLMASELAGSIVLAQIAPLTRAKIEAFSKPPVVRCFSERAKAVEFFYPKSEEIPPSPAATPASPATSASAPEFSTPTAAPAAPSPSNDGGQYKQDIRAKEVGDLGTVRKELSELQKENHELKLRLAEMVITRRDPPDLDAWKEKVARLESDLEAAVKAAQDLASAKK